MLACPVKKPSDHPGVAHYLIHSYDYPPIADKGMTAARRDAEVAPSASHALHMPSHIFTRVCAWQDSVATNERSATAAKAEKEFVDQIHAMDYFEYAYLQLGRDTDARRVVEETPGVPATEMSRATPYALAAIPASFALKWRRRANISRATDSALCKYAWCRPPISLVEAATR